MILIGQRVFASLCVCALAGCQLPRTASTPEIRRGFTTQNFIPAVPVSPQEAEAFVRRYADRVSYLHLKSARGREPLPVLDGNPLPFERIFALLETNNKPVYAAIELASGNAPAEEIYQNMKVSMNRLNQTR